jgi:A/G-specific adenine glycosylase
MLQQTGVERVVPKYQSFLKKFPNARALADSPLSSVLREWQGLGYNRRGKMLHEAAKNIVKEYDGKVPKSLEALKALPGIGEYTAKAVRAFAWNEPEIFIETNIRSVFIHHFFSRRHIPVSDAELMHHIERAVDGKNPREWYWALMDYGSYLKKNIPNPSRKSAHHSRQKPFKGSDREIRGAILRLLSGASHTKKELHTLPFERGRIDRQLQALIKEGFVSVRVPDLSKRKAIGNNSIPSDVTRRQQSSGRASQYTLQD